MSGHHTHINVAPEKQIANLLDRFSILQINDIKSYLAELYRKFNSLKKLSEYLRNKGIVIRAKDLIILMEYFGIPRNKKAEHMNRKTKEYKMFNGDKREMLYLWAFCFGDARIEATLSSIGIDSTARLPTVMCIYNTLKEYLPIDKEAYEGVGGYLYFNYRLDKKSFSFLFKSVRKIVEEIRNFEDLMALLAGLIDAEGSIYLKIRERIYKFRDKINKSISFDHNIEITNCNKEVLLELQKLLAIHGIKATIPQSKTGFGCSRLRIYRREHISKIIPTLLKYMKHSEKVHKLKILWTIIQAIRNKNQKEKRKLLIEFKKQLENL